MDDVSFSDLRTSEDACFLCGATTGQVTQEHVFPKWLQRRFNLWTQRIGLLNDSLIHYRQLTIPCCSRCNSEDLSRLETAVAAAVDGGYGHASALDPHLWYLWAGKIFYGILRRELDLVHNRANPGAGNIVSSTTLKSFSNLHLFLQAIRKRHEFIGDPPYSVLVCNLHDVGLARNYCFRDSLAYMTVSIHMGEIGLIVSLEDGRLTQESYGRFVAEVAGRKLHPIQFDELTAKTTYQLSLLEGGVTYVSSQSTEKDLPAKSYVHGGGYLREWSREEYSHVLRAHVAEWLNERAQNTEWFVPPNLVPTWMADADGQLLLQPLAAWEQA